MPRQRGRWVSLLGCSGNPPLRSVAVDTLARSIKGADENNAQDISLFADNCERIGSALANTNGR